MKRLITVSLVMILGTLAACSSPAAPSAKQAPTQAANSRYMLASGAAPGAGCTDNGDGTQSCPAGSHP
ncbi:MAG TPA: hypothetical protein VK478_08905 [Gemmatimonadaceae bacterium]|nr:hypothetical protein [Gemmatimonadaceae bacterium]